MNQKLQTYFTHKFKGRPTKKIKWWLLIVVFGIFVSIPITIKSLNDSRVLPAEAAQTTTVSYTIIDNSFVMNEDGSEITQPQDGNTSSWLGTASNRSQSYLGLIFQGTPIPSTAEVTNATIEFTSQSNQWLSVKTTIFGELNANPLGFSSNNRPSSRVLSSVQVNTNDNVEWKENSVYSYDVSSIIKDILKTGNRSAFGFVIKGKGNSWGRKFVHGSPSSGKAPKLTITYHIPVTANPSPTVAPSPAAQPTPSASPIASTQPSSHPSTHPSPISGNSHAMGQWSPSSWDTCTKEEHDSYSVIAVDGKRYPTWHPPVHNRSNGTTCTFGHEHGRNPQGSALLTWIKEHYAYQGNVSSSGLPFGLANEALDEYNTINSISNGMRHEDHVGHKIEWENQVQLQVNTCSGPSSPTCQNRINTTITCNFLMKAHQGTHSKDAFGNNMHELAYFADCKDPNNSANNVRIGATKMVIFGKPGFFTEVCDKDTVLKEINSGFSYIPANSPSDGNSFRFIGTQQCVNKYILVPSGQFSDISKALYEDWVSNNYLYQAGNSNPLAYFDPHFAVFSPSRYYDPSKPDYVGRSIDVCWQREANGVRARGGECDSVTNYGQITTPIPHDDPRSPFNGVKREFYFNQNWVNNTSGTTTWYTDPFGKNGRTTSAPGYIKQYISTANNYNSTIFESQAIGGNRWYGGNGVHAPN